MKKIAIIPARSGSKGLKNKNILNLCGKPLIGYTIEAARLCNQFDKIIVSTDSYEYGEIGQNYGAEIIYRDEHLSNDTATTYEVIIDVLNKIPEMPDYIVLLQPTSPLRSQKHINEAIEKFELNFNKFDFLVSVKKAEHPSILVKPIENDLCLKHFNSDFSSYRRQNFEEYTPNGAIYIAKCENYIKQKHFFGARSLAYIMDKKHSIDIDDIIDYKLAEILIGEKYE